MRLSLRTSSIIAALLLSGAMMAGAFWLSGPGIRSASAISTEELLQAYAVKDADADGLPDWQEALYGTDPANPRSVDASMTDAEAVAAGLVTPEFESAPLADVSTDAPGVDAGPQTVTDRFGKKFLENYLRVSQGAPLSDADMAAFIESAVTELAEERTDAYALTDLTLGQGGVEGLMAYVAEMDATLSSHSATRDEKNVFDHFADYVTGTETERSLIRIQELADAYTESAEATMNVAVPLEVSGVHLDFANAFANLGAVTADMAAMGEDPLRGLIGLLSYTDAWDAYSTALAELGKALSEQTGYSS